MISKFYSSATYLDDVISAIAEYSNKLIVEPPTPVVTDSQTNVATKIASADLSKPAQKLIEGISETIEYIYNTPAIDKLRSISGKKWYEPL